MGRRTRDAKTTFTSGELDDILLGRQDLTAYFNGANKIRNALIQPQGGVIRRPGSVFHGELPGKLEPLDLSAMTMPEGGTVANIIDGDSETDATTTTAVGVIDPYVIARIDFGAPTVVGNAFVQNIFFTGATGTPNVTEEVGIQYSTDDVNWSFYGSPLAQMPEGVRYDIFHQEVIAARYWRVAKVGGQDITTATFTLSQFSLQGGTAQTGISEGVRLKPFQFSTEQNYLFAFTDNVVTIWKDGVRQAGVPTPFKDTDLPKISTLQSLDTMLVFHEDIQTFEIRREGGDTLWNGDFVSYSNIPTFDFGDGSEPVWSDARGWPRCGTFHQGRLYVGGSAQRPQTFWASKSGSFFDFDTGTSLDDEAIDATLDSDDVASIFNIFSGRHLQLFTSSGEWYITPENDVITPKNVAARRSTKVGSFRAGLPVVGVEGATMFIQRLGDGLREFIFTDLNNPYEANSISLLAGHLIDDPVELSFRQSLNIREGDVVFVNNTDGTIAALQTLRGQDITAWSLCLTDGLVRASNVDLDTFYWVSERTIGGEQVLYLESWTARTYTDSAVVYSTDASSPTQLPATSLAGLNHLNGRTVQARADGSVMGEFTVVNGAITLPRAAETSAEVGLAFPDVQENEVARLQTINGHTEREAREIVYRQADKTEGDGAGVWVRDMPATIAKQGVETMGERIRVSEITLRLQTTTGLFISANGGDPHQLILRTLGDNLLDEPPPLFSGDKRIGGFLGFSRVDFVDITQRDPVPMNILALAKKVSF